MQITVGVNIYFYNVSFSHIYTNILLASLISSYFPYLCLFPRFKGSHQELSKYKKNELSKNILKNLFFFYVKHLQLLKTYSYARLKYIYIYTYKHSTLTYIFIYIYTYTYIHTTNNICVYIY